MPGLAGRGRATGMVAGRVDFIIDSGGSTPSGRTCACAARFAAASESFFTSFFVLATGLAADFPATPLSIFPGATFPGAAFVVGAGFTEPGFGAALAAALALPGFAAADFDPRLAGTGFPNGFAGFDAGFDGFEAALALGLIATRLAAGRERATLDAVLGREDAEARAGLPTFALGRTTRVRAALVLRELAMKSYLLQAGLCPVLMQPDPIDGRSR